MSSGASELFLVVLGPDKNIPAPAPSRLNNCNALHGGAALESMSSPSAAIRLHACAQIDHIGTLLCELQWLPTGFNPQNWLWPLALRAGN